MNEISTADIIERKQAEEAIGAVHTRATEILESISDIFYAVDKDFNFTYVNHKAEESWTRSRADLIGKHYWTEFPKAVGSESYQMHLKAMKERQPLHYETISPLLQKWIAVNIYPAENGGLSVYFQDIQDRKQAEEALARSEEKYRTLFDSIDEGFCLIELIYDERGEAVDYCFLDANRVFERQTGLAGAAGKRVMEIAPQTESHWLKAYEAVARTGEPVRLENYTEHNGSWYQVNASRVGGAGSRQVAVVFDDITERKRREANLAFLADTSADFAPLFRAEEIMERVGSRLADHLNLSRCNFAIVDEEADHIECLYAWRRDDSMPDVSGAHRITTFLSEEGRRHYAAGKFAVVNDVRNSALLNPATLDQLDELGVRSIIDAPYLKDGRWKFLLTAARSEAGEWRTDEIELIRELAERIYIRIERAHAEEALRLGVAQLQVLLDEMPMSVYLIDADFRISAVNPTALPVFGEIPDLIGRDFDEVIHRLWSKEYADEVVRLFRYTLETGEPYYTPERIEERRDLGVTEYYEWHITRIPLPDGRNGVVCYFRDVSAQVFARLEIAASEKKYRTLFESIDEGVSTIEVLFDEQNKAVDYRFLEINPAFARQTGLENAVGKRMRELIPQHEEFWFETYGQIAKTGEARRFEGEAAALGRIYDVYAFRIGASGENRVAILFNDIGERKRAEEALRESEERYRLFVNTVSDILYKMSADWSEMRLLKGKGVLADTDNPRLSWLETYIPDTDKLLAQTTITEAIRTKQIFELEHRVVRADGTIGWTFSRAIPLLDERGEIVEWFGAATDITERKRAEEAMRVAEERYLALFNSIEQGFCTLEVAFDEQNKPLDYRFLEVSPSFERQTGISNAAGRTMREIAPEQDEHWFEIYGRIALSGEPERFEDYSTPLNRWWSVYAFRIQDPALRRVAALFFDITDRRQSEDALRESEARLRALVENLPGGAVFIVDKNLRYLVAEGEALAAAGFAPEDLVGRTIKEAMPPEFVAEYESLYRQTLAGEAFEHEHDAHGRAFISRGLPLKDAAGEVYAVLAISYDITERKQAEENLRESEERFRAMFEQANVGIVQVDLVGHLIMPNPGFCEIVGYTEEECRGLNVRDITHPDDYQREAELTKQLIKGKIPGFSIEKRYVCKNGGIVWGQMTTTVVRQQSNHPIYALAIVEDITGRKRIEEELRESEERLRLLIESASDYAIFTTTTGGLIDSWNTGAEKVFGWTEEEVLGKSAEIIFTPEDRDKGAPEHEIETARRMGRAPDERFHIRKDGSRFYASGVMTSLKEVGGNVQGFAKIARDMTEQIEAERALRDKELLQKLVGAQEDERKRIARDLHDELGQQLTGLRLKLDAAKKICKEKEICDKIDEIELIAKSIDNGVDFLAWELRPAALDDLGLVPALENYVKQWSHHSGVTAELISSTLKKARFEPEVETNLYRIVQEALNNTHKHAKAKGAEVMLERRDGLIVMLIEDNGIGFNPKDKKNPLKGIGLIGMKERAQLIGGTLEIESAPGRGTTVFVRVPAESVKRSGS